MNALREAAQRLLEGVSNALPYAPHRAEFDAVADAADDLRAALAEQPEPPPEAQTEAEQRSYTFGWFKALEKSREMQEALQIIATAQGKQ